MGKSLPAGGTLALFPPSPSSEVPQPLVWTPVPSAQGLEGDRQAHSGRAVLVRRKALQQSAGTWERVAGVGPGLEGQQGLSWSPGSAPPWLCGSGQVS